MTTYYVKGNGSRIELTDKDFIARGGEKSVYALGGTAYCVYHDPKAAISPDKIRELSVLDRPEIIRPLSELLDGKKKHCGETMPFVKDAFVLCQLFTNAFRRKNSVTNSHVAKITDGMLSVVPYCHKRGIILVDPNETNWLVSHSLDSVFLIDTSCCQTPSYPGTAIKPAIRDWNSSSFTAESDYFSLAVVLAWLWVGIHPYLAHHPDWQHMDANTALEPRMRKHASFFDARTEFNRACRPIDDMPTGLKNWLRAVLQEGKRIPPPSSCGDVSVVHSPVSHPVASTTNVTITKLEEYADDIANVFGDAVTFDPGTVIGFTPVRGVPVWARCDNGMLALSQNIQVSCRAKAVFESSGRIYAVSNTAVNELVFNELGSIIRATVKHVGSLSDLPTTKVFPGCVVQNLLGKYLLSVFPESGRCTQYQLPELEGWQILDAKYERGVFVAMAETSGKYRMVRYRFDKNMINSALVSDQFGDVNFAVTDNGVCALVTPAGELIAFRSQPNSPGERRFSFPSSDMTLFARGPHVVGAVGNVLYRVSLS